MDKRALQSFAVWAKDSLESQIKVSLKLLGIHSDKDIKKAYLKGDITVIEGDSKTYPGELKVKRDQILELIKTDGFDYTIEQFAYTWFNRLIALRFMEIHNYLPHGFKVFPKNNGSIEPDILNKLSFVKDELDLDIDTCNQLKEKSLIEELYRYVLFKQCNSLNGILPMLFSNEYAYLELLLPSTLLKGQTVITELVKIDESNFLDDVEVIGWLYQFYVSGDREEFRKAKVVNKELIPTLTQIFTPDWIVRYMTENSLGRLWLESYPDSIIKKDFKYYVEGAAQTDEVKEQIDACRYNNVDPKNIKVIEPCSGSGHILVYAFDILMLMYEEKGYTRNDIPRLILENNLFGLDVDKRASQLASFSLVMKARSIDNRFFNSIRIVYPQVFEIKDSKMLLTRGFKGNLLELNGNDWIGEEKLSEEELTIIEYVVETFRDGKVIGSLLQILPKNYAPLIKKMLKLHKVTIRGIFNGEFVEYGLKRIYQLLQLADVLSQKYDVMITNPPYLGITKLEMACKNYAIKNYPISKDDMFAMFMEVNFVKRNGYKAVVNPDSWMFLSSFEALRFAMIKSETMITMCHLGMGAFDSVVQTTAFVIRNSVCPKYIGTYFRLIKNKDKENALKSQKNLFNIETSKFSVIPGSPFAYWINKELIFAFEKYKSLEDYSITRAGLSTGDNNLYLKLWFEVNINSIAFNLKNNREFINSQADFVPCNKGGKFRKWYGNNEYVVKWSESSNFHRPRTTYLDLYYKSAITWSAITTGKFNCRFYGEGFLFDHAAASLFVNDREHMFYILGFLNSNVSYYILNMLNPTINTGSDVLLKLPLNFDNDKIEAINNLVSENIQLSKNDWDSYELSWNYDIHPFLKYKTKNLYEIYQTWNIETLNRFQILRSNEEMINKIFIDLYSLSNQLEPHIIEKEVSVKKSDVVKDTKSLISYIVGIIFGRFSVSENGIQYAGPKVDRLQVDENDILFNSIVSVSDKPGIDYELSEQVSNYVKLIFGEINFSENMNFIAESIGKQLNESSIETVNRYLFTDFIKDHIINYQKRPIYWMFSSGKHNAFRCMIYMHKYTEDTLATINSKYLLPESARLKFELEEVSEQIKTADEKTKRILEKSRIILENKYTEIVEYGQVLDHMANKYITIDLDDGVKVNYEKFQGVEIVTDSGIRIKKDLLVPIK